MDRKGRLTSCDYPGCNEWCFCEVTGEGETDGGYTRWNTFEDRPDGWESFFEEGKSYMLCPEHAFERKQVIDDFYRRGAPENGSN